jgi:hypothetical protein
MQGATVLSNSRRRSVVCALSRRSVSPEILRDYHRKFGIGVPRPLDKLPDGFGAPRDL